MFNLEKENLTLNFSAGIFYLRVKTFFDKFGVRFLFLLLAGISIYSYIYFYLNGLGLSYNDARSHLDIGRRVVEGLKPGIAQLGSVWLPLPHILMIPTIWNDFMWHSGLSGALISMASFVATSFFIYSFLKELGIGILGRLIGVFIFAANLNILYLQSTAMTELLLLATMTGGAYELLLWFKNDNLLNLIKSSFFIMLSTLVRYDGWFLFVFAAMLIGIEVFRKRGYRITEGIVILFSTLAGLGIFLWFMWNLLIFKDPLYFVFGPYSAYIQQEQLAIAGNLATKANLLFSIKVYLYSVFYNCNTFITILAGIAGIVFLLDKKLKVSIKIAAAVLLAPLIFNILSLYLGQSVLFIQGLSGNTWFNARYGVVMMPSIAVFVGYLVQKAGSLKYVLIGLMLFVLFFSFANLDSVTIDDARVGSSQKNVSEVSGWLAKNANKKGFILISAASHDAIIFSSGFPMSKFIHEGTGAYWDSATASPDRWARWIVMRTNDLNDSAFRLVRNKPGFKYFYNLVGHYPFADIYEIKPEYVKHLNTKPIIKINK